MGKTIEKIMDDLWNGWSLDNREDFKTLDDRLKQIDALTARAESAERERDEALALVAVDLHANCKAAVMRAEQMVANLRAEHERAVVERDGLRAKVVTLTKPSTSERERDEAKTELAALAVAAGKVIAWWDKREGLPIIACPQIDALRAALEEVKT
jgi:hypothetical protein